MDAEGQGLKEAAILSGRKRQWDLGRRPRIYGKKKMKAENRCSKKLQKSPRLKRLRQVLEDRLDLEQPRNLNRNRHLKRIISMTLTT
jgi:hypothetical protein